MIPYRICKLQFRVTNTAHTICSRKYFSKVSCPETLPNSDPVKQKCLPAVSAHVILCRFTEKYDVQLHKRYIFDFSKGLFRNFYSITFIRTHEDLEKFDFKMRYVFLLDNNCNKSNSFLKEAYSRRLLGFGHTWILFSENSSEQLTPKLDIEINSEIFLVKKQGCCLFSMKALYKYINFDDYISFNNITVWSPEDGFLYFNELVIPKNRSNLLGIPLKVSYYYSYLESLQYLTEYKDINKDNGLKYHYILLDILAEYLNATHQASFTTNFGLNFNYTTQLFEPDSMLGDVQRGIADVVGVYVWLEDNKFPYFRFFAQVTRETIEFVYRAPTIPVVENVYLLPFANNGWNLILLCMVIATAILYIILIYEKNDLLLRTDSSIVDVIMILMSALLQKTWTLEFKSFAGKLGLTIISLTFMLIYTAYSASIIVFLQGTTKSIKTFGDLFKAEFDLGTHDVSYNYYYYLTPYNERTDENWRKKVYQKEIAGKSLERFFMSSEKGMTKVRDEYFAFQCQASIASNLIDTLFLPQEKCNVRFAPTIYSSDDLYLAIRSNCSYMDQYRVGMLKIIEHGIHKRSYNRLFTKKPSCEGNNYNFSGIGLRETRYIFIYCFIGFAISFSLFLTEVFVSYACRMFKLKN